MPYNNYLYCDLHSDGSSKQFGHIALPQPIQVLVLRLHAQCLQSFIVYIYILIV